MRGVQPFTGAMGLYNQKPLQRVYQPDATEVRGTPVFGRSPLADLKTGLRRQVETIAYNPRTAIALEKGMSPEDLKEIGATMLSVPVPSTDGQGKPVTLQAWYLQTQPQNPLLLFVHGRNGITAAHAKLIKGLLKDGFNVFAYNGAGFDEAGRKKGQRPSEEALYANFVSVLDRLEQGYPDKTHPEASLLPTPPQQITVFAHSMGVNVAAAGLSRYQQKWKKDGKTVRALVACSGFHNFRRQAQHPFPGEKSRILKFARDIKLDQILFALVNRNFMDTISHIASLPQPVPLLVMHHEKDNLIPVAPNAQLIYQAMRLPGERKQLYVIPGAEAVHTPCGEEVSGQIHTFLKGL